MKGSRGLGIGLKSTGQARKLSKVMKISDKNTRSNATVSKSRQIRASSDMQTLAKRPKVSVIMPVFNEEDFVGDTIESVLNQTFGNFEFIIINDGSTDGTQDILENYARKDERITILTNENNMGLTRSLNRGIENSKGKYIARIDAGDICHPNRLEKQVKFLDKNRDVYIVGSYHYWINENGRIIGKYKFPTGRKQIKKNLFGFVSIAAHPTLMIRRELFEKTGLYDISYSTSMEYELYIRTIKNGWEIVNLPEFLVYVLRREKGISESKIKTIFVNQFRIRARYLSSLLNFRNFAYTVASMFLVFVPSSSLRRIVRISIANPKIREIFMKA